MIIIMCGFVLWLLTHDIFENNDQFGGYKPPVICIYKFLV